MRQKGSVFFFIKAKKREIKRETKGMGKSEKTDRAVFVAIWQIVC